MNIKQIIINLRAKPIKTLAHLIRLVRLEIYARLGKVYKIENIKVPISKQWSFLIKDAIDVGIYEKAELSLLSKFLQKTDRVMELGTGAGLLSAYCAKKIGDAHVFTYEANPKLEPMIKALYQRNGINPTLSMCMLGKSEGTTAFYVSNDFWSSSTVQRHGTSNIQVSTKNINEEIRKRCPNFLIIDIEGGEYDLFNIAILENVDKILIELHPHIIGENKTKEIMDKLESNGFGVVDSAMPNEPVYMLKRKEPFQRTVSIVMPTYNRSHMINKAIKSVVEQTYKDWELIIIDDGSTDQTREVVERWRAIEPGRIRYHYHANWGICRTRSDSVSLTRGKYLAFLDDDDVFYSDKLEKQVAFMEENKQKALVYGQVRFVSANGEAGDAYPQKPVTDYKELLEENVIQVSSVLIRKSAFSTVGTFRDGLDGCDDYEMWLRIARRMPIAFMPGPVADYHQHPEAISQNRMRRLSGEIKVYKECLRHDKDRYIKDWIRRKCSMLSYVQAGMLYDRNDHLNATKLYAQAILFDGRIGNHLPWGEGKNLFYRLIRPYFAAGLSALKACMPRTRERADANARGPIFILGCERSGTTLLRAMLNEHPRIAIPYEAGQFRFMVSEPHPWEKEWHAGEEVEAVVREFLAHYKVEFWGVSYEKVMARLTGKQVVRYADIIGSIYATYAEKKYKVRWGDKTPANAYEVAELAKAFPDAKFIHIIRDGRDVAMSWSAVDWVQSKSIKEFSNRWNGWVWSAQSQKRALGKSRYYEVHYEDLVCNPSDTLKRVCRFIHEDYRSSMLSYVDNHMLIPDECKKHHDLLSKYPDKSRVFAWKKSMSAQDQRVFNRIAGPALAKYGYELPVTMKSFFDYREGYQRLRGLRRRQQISRHMKEVSKAS